MKYVYTIKDIGGVEVMDRVKQEIRKVNWRNVFIIALVGLIGFILGTITNMIYTYNTIEKLLLR